MVSYKVLDAADRAQRAEWIRLWEAWPGREIFAHPSYVTLFAREHDRVLCHTYVDDFGRILFPTIARVVPKELSGDRSTLWDLTSPYGYGGPFKDGTPPSDAFWMSLRQWAESERVISLFSRLSLFPDQLAESQGEICTVGPNIVRTLNTDLSDIWMDYAHKVRKNVQRAQRSGLTVEVDGIGSRLDEFCSVYQETMLRRSASEYYLFPREFFNAIVAELSGQFAFFHVLCGGEVVSTELVLVSNDYVYSFLGGTRASAFEMRPNDLLKHSVVEWAKSVGKRGFVLGGGYEPADGIFRYKQAFAPTGAVPFRVARLVLDRSSYEAMIVARRVRESLAGGNWSPRQDYFPAYRG